MSIAVKRHQHFSVLCIQWKYYAVTYSNNVAISWINQSVLTKKQKQLSNKVNLQWLQSSCSHVHWATTTIPPFNWTNITGSITLTAAITDTPNDLHRLGIRDRRKSNKCSTALNLGYYTCTAELLQSLFKGNIHYAVLMVVPVSQNSRPSKSTEWKLGKSYHGSC